MRNAPTLFGSLFGYELRHNPMAHKVTIDITQHPRIPVRYLYPCRVGSGARSAQVDGAQAASAVDPGPPFFREELPLTVRQAAIYLGVSVQTMYLWVE